MDEKKGGITSKRKAPSVKLRPYRPENKKLSKADFIARREKEDEANAAAEEARRKVLQESGEGDGDEENAEQKELLQKEIAKLRANLKKEKKKLEEDPDNAKAKASVEKLTQALDKAESELDELN